MARKSKRKSRKKEKKVETYVPTTHKCTPNCPYFPDMTSDNYRMDENGVKYRYPPKVFRCCFDNHPIAWDVTCPLTILSGSNQPIGLHYNKEYWTKFENELKKKKEIEWAVIASKL